MPENKSSYGCNAAPNLIFACLSCSDKVDKHFEMVAEKGRALLREAAERVL